MTVPVLLVPSPQSIVAVKSATVPFGLVSVKLATVTVPDIFSIDTLNPTLSSIGVSRPVVTNATASFTVTAIYSEAMDTSVIPIVAFSPAVSSTLTLNAGASGWTSNTTYAAVYTVANSGVVLNGLSSVGITVTGGKDAAAVKGETEAEPPAAEPPAPETPADTPAPGPAAAKAPGEAAARPAPAPRRVRKAPSGRPRRRVVRARARYVRTPARKARIVCLHLRGKSVAQARAILAFTPREVARDWSKLLESAVANAEANHELVEDDLIIRAAYADEGPTIRRFRPRAMGRATPIRKRTTHLTIMLSPGEGERSKKRKGKRAS